MIRIFIKIRKKLLTENKFSKYLLYAIGEIVLVMIGILLALQVNNGNENRKIKIKEKKTLIELRKDLNQNLNDISENIINLQNSKKSNETIIYHIENNIAYNDSLAYHFSIIYPFVTFSANQTTYETLKQGGMELISNESLRNSISDIYSTSFKSYQTLEKTYLVNHYLNYIKPMLISEFTTFRYKSYAYPKNYNQFIKNSEYKQIIDFTIGTCADFIRMQSNLKTKVQNLIDSVNNEIDE
jgi:hypothetical protein